MQMPPIRYVHARDDTRVAYTIIAGASPPWLHLYSLNAPTIELDFSVAARFGYIQNLARGRATVLYDPRGSGFSGPIEGTLTLDDLVDDVAAVTEAVGEPVDVSVMGSGCHVALRYAGRHGAGWRSLVLFGAVSLAFRGSFQDRAWRDGDYLGYLASATRVSMDVSPAEAPALTRRWAEQVPKRSAALYREAVLEVDSTEDANRVGIPTLVISSASSRRAAELAAHIPGARLAPMSVLVNRPELGSEVRDLWDAQVGGPFGDVATIGEGLSVLSQRELDVLRLMARGRSNAEIAKALTLSVRTVERHLQNVYGKLRVHNRVEAAAWTLRHRIG